MAHVVRVRDRTVTGHPAERAGQCLAVACHRLAPRRRFATVLAVKRGARGNLAILHNPGSNLGGRGD